MAQGVRWLMDAVVTVLVAVVGILGGYILGNWRLKYEHLHERRAEAIAELSRLLAAVQDSVVQFVNYRQPQDVDRDAQIAQVRQAMSGLIESFRSNEVWLEPDSCLRIEAFVDKVYTWLGDYMATLNERGYPIGEQGQRGRELGLRILREAQPLRRELIDEFRAILYPPRWYEAPLRVLELPERRGTQRRQASEGPADTEAKD